MRYESAKTEKGNVGVSYVSQIKANEQAEVMDATDCTNCTDCTDCTNCTGCTGCTDCTNCTGCTNCTDCTGCTNCTDCTGCTDCANCTGCKYFVDGELATKPEQQIENLDKVRAIILDSADRLQMTHWHGGDEWKTKTCAEEAVCGTTHCLAGWLQVCSTNPDVRAMEPEIGGAFQAPVAAKLFYSAADEVIAWLTKREYVKELGVEAQP